MKRITLLSVVCLILLQDLQAQINIKRKDESRINISYTPQWYLHSLGAVNHYGDDYDQQVIYPHNTFGQSFELEYQRTTRYGLIMSIGVQTGMEKHNFDVRYNFGYVDAGAPELKNAWVDDTQFKATVKQVAIRFMAGYQWKSPVKGLPGWDVEAKAGIALRYYTNAVVAGNYNTFLTYEKNDTFFMKRVASNYIGFGSEQKFLSGFHSAFIFDIGVTRNINLGFVRTLSIGIDGTYGLRKGHGSSGGAHIGLFSLDNYTGTTLSYSQNDYSSPDFALGIRFAVGLWPDSKGER